MTDLPSGSLVVERYVYTTRNGNDGVQWLAEIVEGDALLLLDTCKTRREAIEVIARYSAGAA